MDKTFTLLQIRCILATFVLLFSTGFSPVQNVQFSLMAVDVYEPDNSSGQAKSIVAGEIQTRSISPVGDADWATFTLTEASAVTISANGSNLSIWLYDSSETFIAYDGDSYNYPSITLDCFERLMPGEYYIRVESFSGTQEIAEYTLQYSIDGICPDKTSPENDATEQALQLNLYWNPVPDADYYLFCIDEIDNDTCDTSQYMVGNVTQAYAGTLGINKTYYWQVFVNIDGSETEFDNGNWFHFATRKALMYKSASYIGHPNYNQWVLSWDSLPTATEYLVCLYAENETPCIDDWVSMGTNTEWYGLVLEYETTYHWQVRAVTPTGTIDADNGTWGDFTTGITPPGSFHKLKPDHGATNQSKSVSISWTASPRVSYYEYCVSNSYNTCDTEWITTYETSVTLPEEAYNISHYWQVRATNNSGFYLADNNAFYYYKIQDDPYEDDNIRENAKAILPGETQVRSPDRDWIKFTLTQTSAIFLDYRYPRYRYESGLALFDSDNDLIDARNDFPPIGSLNSAGYNQIDRECGFDALGPGTYYVESSMNNEWVLRDYTVTLTVTPCAQPEPFRKAAPLNAAVNQPINMSLSWNRGPTNFAYSVCFDEVDNGKCDTQWVELAGNNRYSLPKLKYLTTYYWQVRADTGISTSYADGRWWKFTTQQPVFLTYLPGIIK